LVNASLEENAVATSYNAVVEHTPFCKRSYVWYLLMGVDEIKVGSEDFRAILSE